MSVISSDILAGASGQAGAPAGYEIERSLRFNDDDSAYLSRTPSSSSNLNTWTWSGWVKRSNFTGDVQMLISAGNDSNNVDLFYFDADDTLKYLVVSGGSVIITFETDAVFRDCSAWYHIVAARSGSTFNVYVNGVSQSFQTSTGSTSNTFLSKASTAHAIGARVDTSYAYEFDGYLADVHWVDGTALAATDFGALDDNGVWQPQAYSGSYGTNGFHLDFSDNTSTTTIAEDSSGNGNHWTATNISVAAGKGNDSLLDSPTNGTQTDTGAGGEVSGNYCTFNNAIPSATAASNGALEFASSSSWQQAFGTTLIPSSGKWYYEITAAGVNTFAGIILASEVLDADSYIGTVSKCFLYYFSNGNTIEGPSNTQTAYGATGVAGDVMGVALDMDGGTLTFYKNGTSQGTAFSSLTGSYLPILGVNSSGGGTAVANFGQRAFAYAAPSGFKALCTTNLPEPTIADGSDYMDVVTYLGDGNVSRTISSLDFAPDLVWLKSRNNTGGDFSHRLFDTARGIDLGLSSNSTNAEENRYTATCGGVHAFTSNGFTLSQSSGNVPCHNASNNSMVAWTWDAGTTTVSNTDGSITSSVRANPSAGFSIVTYTGNGNNYPTGATVGHGLNVAPQMVIVKSRGSASTNWAVWHTKLSGADYTLLLNDTGAQASGSNSFNQTLPTSSVFSVGQASGGTRTNENNVSHVAYCFAPVEGYSAFGSYTGNGNADGPFVYTGFRPRWIMTKRTDTTGEWWISDSARDTYNAASTFLWAQSSGAEVSSTSYDYDILSNGFKLKTTYADRNASGGTFVYIAFGENPFSIARAR